MFSQSCQFGKILPNSLQDIMLFTKFRIDACMYAQTTQKHNTSLQRCSNNDGGTERGMKTTKSDLLLMHQSQTFYRFQQLYSTPSTPAVPNRCCSKSSAPYWSNPRFLPCEHMRGWSWES